MRYPLLGRRRCPRAQTGRPPGPERVGEPGVFKHVIYIIKENRTYDQVLGDVKEGNGDPSACAFRGARHAQPAQAGPRFRAARQHLLLRHSQRRRPSMGRQPPWPPITWNDPSPGFRAAIPDGMGDETWTRWPIRRRGSSGTTPSRTAKRCATTANSPSRASAGKIPRKTKAAEFLDCYHDFINGSRRDHRSQREPAIESLRPYLATNTVGWDLNVPDVFRAAQFIERTEAVRADGQFPNLIIICLPNDHTSGTKPARPTPDAQVADNDLALGQIVEAVSRSRFWTETCIFAIEDDPQDGWDHVSGFRTTAYVASPYTGAARSSARNTTRPASCARWN